MQHKRVEREKNLNHSFDPRERLENKQSKHTTQEEIETKHPRE